MPLHDTSHCKLYGTIHVPCMKSHPLGTHAFTCLLDKYSTFNVCCPEVHQNRSHAHYKLSPSFHQKDFNHVPFFLSLHTFSWACRGLCEPQKFFFKLILHMHFSVCQITHSFPNVFQPNLYSSCSTSSIYMLFSICHTYIFSLK